MRKHDKSTAVLPYKGIYEPIFVIDVDPHEAERAEAALVEWERPQLGRAIANERRLLVISASSLVLPALWLFASAFEIDGIPTPTTARVILLWVVCFVVAGQIENRRGTSDSTDPVA